MFAECSSLTYIPNGLFANRNVGLLAFYQTFKDCTSLTSIPKDLFAKLSNQANTVNAKKLLAFMEKLSGIEADLKYALNPRVLLEITCLECASLDENGSKKN